MSHEPWPLSALTPAETARPDEASARETADDLPTGARVIGRALREDIRLDVAEAIERAVVVPTPVDPRA
jgi:hypothetical protein